MPHFTVNNFYTFISNSVMCEGERCDCFLLFSWNWRRSLKNKYFISYSLLVPGPCLAFRTDLILCVTDLTRRWKHSSAISVHIDMTASHRCCIFVGCTSIMWISCLTSSQRCSARFRSGDCVEEFNVSDVACYSAASSHQTVTTLWS